MLHPFAPRDQFNPFPFARFGGGGGYRNRPVAYIRKTRERGRILQFFPEWEDDTHSRRSKTLAALPLTLAPPRAFAQGYIQINPHIRRETCGMIQSTNIAAEGAPVSFRLRFCPKKFPHFPGCFPSPAPPPPPAHPWHHSPSNRDCLESAWAEGEREEGGRVDHAGLASPLLILLYFPFMQR